MTGITASGRKGIAAVVLLTAGLMAGCSSDGKGAPAWTAEPGGWIGLVVEPQAGASAVIVRATGTTLAP